MFNTRIYQRKLFNRALAPPAQRRGVFEYTLKHGVLVPGESEMDATWLIVSCHIPTASSNHFFLFAFFAFFAPASSSFLLFRCFVPLFTRALPTIEP